MNRKKHDVEDTSVQQITKGPATSAENLLGGKYAHTALTNLPNTVINKSFWCEKNCTFTTHLITRLAISKLPDNTVEKELPPVTITLEDLKPLSFDVVGHKDAIVNELLSYRLMLASNNRIRQSTIIGGINIYTMVVVDSSTGITLRLNSLLQDYLYQQKSYYLNAPAKYIATLPDLSTAKLYELLLCKMQQYGEPLLRFSADDLASVLSYTPKGAFTPFIFVDTVIKPAVDAINRDTNCRVSFKCGREYKDIRFFVEVWKTREEKQETIQEEEYWLDPARMLEESSTNKHKAALCMKTAREQALETGEGESFSELWIIKDY